MPPKQHAETKHCRLYARGTCLRGDGCIYAHDPAKQLSPSTSKMDQDIYPCPPQTSSHVQLSSSSPTSSACTSPIYVRHPAIPAKLEQMDRKDNSCFAWRSGSCQKGDKCGYGHDAQAYTRGFHCRDSHLLRLRAQIQNNQGLEELSGGIGRGRIEDSPDVQFERYSQHEAVRTEAHASVESIERKPATHKRTKVAGRECADVEIRERQPMLEAQERARQEAQIRSDAAKTVQRVTLGSIVTYGAGLSIRGFTTGFESCIVQVCGLPADAIEREIYELFTQQGIDEARLQLVSNEQLQNGTREVKMAMDAEAGCVLSVGLNKLEFRDRHLDLKVGSYNIPGAMDVSDVKNTNVLTISWQAASISYIVRCHSLDDAREKIQQINSRVYLGHPLKADHTAELPHVLATPSCSIFIKIENLPISTTCAEVQSFVGLKTWVRVLPTKGAVNSAAPLELVRRAILSSGCPDSDIVSLNQSETDADALAGSIKIQAQFRTGDRAKHVYDYLDSHDLANGVRCDMQLPSPFSYNIVVPLEQYNAQRAQWGDLWSQARDASKVWCSLGPIEVHNETMIRARVCGFDRKAVGALKARVEALAAGEKVLGWHYTFDRRPEHSVFTTRVLARSRALVRIDRHERQITLYGSPNAIAQARAMITDELARLAGLEHTTHIPPAFVRFFIERGLPELRELLGTDNVRFDSVARTLTTSGGDTVQHIISRILEQAAAARTVLPIAGEDTCPICFDTVSAPILLSCGHAYCSTCLRHFVTSAADADKFPLVCMGDEARCNVPIAIPFIEHFLSKHVFAHLLETAFRVHVSQHPLQLKYCRTPGCEQIYRVVPQGGPRSSPVQCPACLSLVCPVCHTDGHEGMTCGDSRVHNDPAEQERLVDEWVASQSERVKRCPQCRVLTEKTEGCNHMSCKCGAHFCWRCLGVFDAREIYRHMNTAQHGGMYAGEPAANAALNVAGMNYAEQEDLLRQAAARRAAEQRARNHGRCTVM